MAPKKKSYFQANQDKFDLWAGHDKSKGLRECQLGAYWAVWAHFTTTDEPALLSLPTGSGKTALMMALAFGFKAERVLIVTAAQILRDQTARDFENLDILKEIEVIAPGTTGPNVKSNSEKLRTKDDWQQLENYDVVTAHPRTTSPKEKGVCSPPAGLFDLVFIDEAHHEPAPTWSAILKAFKGVKCILLTATPFRRDKRRIHAPLIYHYSIGKALDCNIYRPVKYIAVDGGNQRLARDKALCEKAKEVLTREKKKGNASKLLIRADRVDWSARLVKLYKDNGINVEAVDYTKSWDENKSAIETVRNGQSDGMVCVGMLGEGLDLPELKIAVLHSAPRSLPFTLQFVGRVSRFSSSQTGDAYLLSVPDEVRGEMRRLHKNDANWRKLIPALADEVIGKVTELKHFRSPYAFEDLDINPLSIKPFFSVRVYTADPKDINLEAELELPDDIGICFSDTDDSVLVVITECEDEPAWAKDTGILETKFDLHVYYFSKKSKLLFETTTSDEIAKKIRSAITGDKVERISPDEIMRVLKGADAGSYFMVGLKNAIGRGPAQPTYKTVMGREVQASVRPTDGKIFAPGHALVKLDDEETRGIGTLQSRIWAIKRDNVNEFQKWCEDLASELKKDSGGVGLPQLGFLATSSKLSELSDRPLAVLVDAGLFGAIRKIKAIDPAGGFVQSDIVPFIEIKSYKKNQLDCEICFHSAEPGIPVRFSVSDGQLWERLDGRDLNIRLEFSDNKIFDSNLLEYLNEFPPTLVMPKGGVIIDRYYWKPSEKPGPLPDGCLQTIKWKGCDIEAEAIAPKHGHLNIHDWIQQKLDSETSSAAIIIKDDSKGEIADFVVIEPKERSIIFYHCKAMKAVAPTDSVGDAYEVLGQACRNGIWILSPSLMKGLYERTQPPRSSPIVKGKSKKLKDLIDGFSCNAWKYKIVVVQPGFKCSIVEDSKKLNPLLIASYEWLRGSEAEFEIWGS